MADSQPILSHSDLQNAVVKLGEEIFARASEESQSIFSKDWWYGRIMDWSMQNERFKTQMFRFVDVLPNLNSGQEIARHLKEYFSEGGDKLPSVLSFGMGMGAIAPSLMAGTIKKNITQMAKMFITGENPQEALTVLKKARKNHIGFTVDLLGEATLNEKEALEYQKKYIELINWLANDIAQWPADELLDNNHLGAIPRVNVSVKLTSLYSQLKTEAWQPSIEQLKERLRPIFRVAKDRGVFVNLDMEQYDYKDLILEVFTQIIMEDEFRHYPHWGVVVQAYLRDALKDLEKLKNLAQIRGTPFTIRLVKGAYWDFEKISSEQRNWAYPVYTIKKESDACFEACAEYILKNYLHLHLAVGSHNVRSIAAALSMAQKLGVPQKAIEVQMLYGMAEPFKKALTGMGVRVREYSPIGELIPGMAYLVRRLLENTSNESFLRSKFADHVGNQELLKNPIDGLTPSTDRVAHRPFANEALIDFKLIDSREKMRAALELAQKESKKIYPLFIDGKEIKTDRTISSINPSQTNETIGTVCIASEKEAELAVQAAKRAYSSWRHSPAQTRAQLIDKLADLMLRDRFALTALEVREAGKTWREADGDITEAIDFCRYYARDMRALATPLNAGSVPGEVNLYTYSPRGVTAVIAPWNFPLAILTGMVAAAVVTGNTVVMKPAEQTSLIAAKLSELLREAGCPAGVVNFLPGYGEEVGEYLVKHKDIATITFTGSKVVGLGILRKASEIAPGQSHVKRCIIEMGGKNAIIVDDDADLDEAIHGVTYSSFGFQGQKCSACSRVIVLEGLYDRFVERLLQTVASIKILPADNPDAYLGPVIDQAAFEKINSLIEIGKQESKLAYQAPAPSGGYFVGPTIFTDVAPTARIAQEEIFGPVLAVIKAKDIEQALEIANNTEYGLTGGLYSRSPAHIELVRRGFEVGNLYINRGITGAMVERHPFGGFKMSGIGSKTGGPDYLKQYMEPRNCSENTFRRGFAPEESAAQPSEKT